jgi:hypothetical protein
MQNFKTIRQLLLGELAMSPERRKREREKNAIYSGQWPPTFMPAAKGSARTPLGPMYQFYFSNIQ